MPHANATRRRSPQADSLDDLQAAHRQLESRLTKLSRHRSLSPEERFEIQVLKKRKLAIKDRIRTLGPSE